MTITQNISRVPPPETNETMEDTHIATNILFHPFVFLRMHTIYESIIVAKSTPNTMIAISSSSF